MVKNLLSGVIGTALLIVPLSVSAQTVDYSSLIAQLQSEVQALTAQISALEAQNSGGSTATVSASVVSPCVSLSHNLYLGVSDAQTGGEVTTLQQFLTGTNDYTYGSTTGYFGPATETAVQRYQARAGIVSSGSPETTGFGIVGPSTRRVIVQGCSSGNTGSPSLTVSPTSGKAPLAVTFTSSVSGTVNFGDGASGTLVANPTPALIVCPLGSTTCVSPTQTWSVQHTYASPGTYAPSLSGYSCPLVAGLATCATQAVVTVTSSGTVSSTPSLTVSPTSGAAPLNASFTSNQSGTVNFGDGTSGTLVQNPIPLYACSPSSVNCTNPTPTYSVSHTYQSAGTYTATLSGYACPGTLVSCSTAATVTVTSSGIQTQAPVISTLSPTSGPVGTVLTITGSGFTSTGNQLWCMTGCPSSPSVIPYAASNLSSNGSVISYLLPGSHVGTYAVAIVNSNGTSNTETFTVTPPTITSLSPTSGPVGTQLTIIGTGFTPNYNNQIWCMSGCTYSPGVIPGATGLPSSDSTTLTYTIPSMSAGVYTIAVVNNVGDRTNSATFTVTSSGTVSTTPSLTVSPTSGAAPLSVTFTTNQTSSTIAFGDGSSGSVQGICTASYPATCSGTASHTYQSAGTYTATLSGYACPGTLVSCSTAATVTVTSH